MKKILGISLCALFAVSAANANIASQEYVDEVVGAIDTSGIATNAGNITALDGRVTTSEGKISTLEGKVSTNETNIGTNTTNIQTNTGNIATNAGNITANANAIADINDNITGMDFGPTSGHYVKNVSQADGTVAATGASFETTLNATTQDNAPTSKAVADYVAGQVNDLNVTALTGRVAANEGKITTLEGKVGTNETNIATNEGKINTLDEDIQAMDLTATTGDYVKVVSQSNGTVQATGASFDTSVSDTSESTIAPTSKAVATYVKEKVDGLGVPALAGRVTANEGAIATNKTNIQTNAGNITTLTGRVDVHDTSINSLEEIVGGLGTLATKSTVTNAEITDGTIMNADINNNAEIASSKIKFTDVQDTVFTSGINSGHVTQIGTNARNIASNTTNIESMGTQVTANENNITDLQGRMTTAEGKIGNNSTLINSILNATGATTCDDTEAGCTLVLSSAGLKWETVKR